MRRGLRESAKANYYVIARTANAVEGTALGSNVFQSAPCVAQLLQPHISVFEKGNIWKNIPYCKLLNWDKAA